jgi:integrase/recombinase XerD
MDDAVADAAGGTAASRALAIQYRDGLIIALLALVPLRSRTLTALQIGQHLVRAGNLWALDIPAADTKTRRALDFPLSAELSGRIDVYLEQFRQHIPDAAKHTGLWASEKRVPMNAAGIYQAVRKRTKKALGFGVNLHRFRHAAASFWSTHDPANVRGVKDLLGHASFGTTEKHYVMAQSRLAGRALANALGALRNDLQSHDGS